MIFRSPAVGIDGWQSMSDRTLKCTPPRPSRRLSKLHRSSFSLHSAGGKMLADADGNASMRAAALQRTPIPPRATRKDFHETVTKLGSRGAARREDG